MFSVILYTHQPPEMPEALRVECFRRLHAAILESADSEPCPPSCIVVSTRPYAAPAPWRNVLASDARGPYFDCYTKIVAGCSVATHAQTYLVEHDVLYPDGYFGYVMPASRGFGYNRNTVRLSRRGYFRCPGQLTSNCVADRALLLAQFRARLDLLARGGRVVWDEPGRNAGDIAPMLDWWSAAPVVDVRWGGNLTGDREAARYLSDVAPWGKAAEWIRRLAL